MLDYEDGSLPWADAARLETDITRAIRDVAPEAVITFDEDGLYLASRSHRAARADDVRRGLARLGDAPALYYVSVPPGRMRALQARPPHGGRTVADRTISWASSMGMRLVRWRSPPRSCST